MARKKVFIDGTPLIGKHLSGVGQVVLETVRALDSEEFSDMYDFVIFLPYDEKGKIDYLKLKNITIKYLPYPHKFLSLFSRMALSPPLDLFLGKGVYVFMNFRNWPLLSSKSITYIHDVAFLKYPQYIEPRNLRFLSRYTKQWVRRTTKVVAVSNTTADEIREKIPMASHKVEVVVNAVNTKFYTPRSKQLQDQVKAKYGLTDFVLFVSNIEPRKNVLTLINAYKQSIGKADTQLFIVGGGGWLNEPILEAIESARREGFNVIKNKSFVPDEDLPLLMQAARTLVIPSWHEGFGLPLLQAVASGGSVIASDIPALREAAALVRNKNVSFFNPKDTEELAVKLSGTKPKGVQSVAKSIEIRDWTDAARELMTLVDTVEVGKK